MNQVVEITRRFARALDNEDYETAQDLLSGECVYALRGKTHFGPTAIIASYKGNGDSAKNDFDEVEYESRVNAQSDTVAEIEFIDRLRVGNETLTFQCRQIVEIDDDGRIIRIEHIDLPGQREALDTFKQQVGLRQ